MISQSFINETDTDRTYSTTSALLEALLPVETEALTCLRAYLEGEANEAMIMTGLRQGLDTMRSILTTNPDLRDLPQRGERFIPREGLPLFNECLASTPSSRLTLLGISRLKPIPRHDHPQTCGLLRVLSGRLRVRQYEEQDRATTSQNIALLKQVDERILRAGDHVGFLPGSGNIHDLHPQSLSVVVLSLHVGLAPALRGNWYFPIDLLRPEGNSLLCNRIPGMSLDRASSTSQDKVGDDE